MRTLLLAIGATCLAGWLLDAPLLCSFMPGFIGMKANTAICFLLLGFALWLVPFHSAGDGWRRLIARVPASAALVFGLVSICEYVFQWNSGLDQLFVRDTGPALSNVPPGRLAMGTAGGVVLASGALLLMSAPRGGRWRARVLAVCGTLIALLGLFSPIGYTAADPLLVGWWRATAMALPTAACLVLLGGAILLFAWQEARVGWTAERTVALGFSFTMTMLVCISVSSYLNDRDMLVSSLAVQHSQEVLNKIQDVLYDVVDAETGRRGYQLTGDQRFLDPYWTGTRELGDDLARLRKLTADDPGQHRRIARLEPLLEQRLAQFKVQLDLMQTAPKDSEKQRDFIYQGKETMGRIRAAIGNMEQAENRLLMQRNHAVEAAARRAFYVEPLGDALAYVAIVAGMVILLRDMAQRRRIEAELRASEEQQRLARQEWERTFDSVPDLIAILDDQHRIVRANRAMAQRLGLTPARCVGQTCYACVHGTDKPPANCPHLLTLADHQPHSTELREERLGGDFLITTTPLVDEHGRSLGIVHVAHDITDLKRAEEQRRTMEAQLQHAQKMESLGVLAGGIAHDFNNLLMVILGNADLVLPDLPEHARGRGRIATIQKATQRAADLCQQMLAYAGKARFLLGRVNLNQVIKEMGELLEVSISKKAVLEYKLAPNLPPVEADATQLRQVIMNLISNAAEAIGEREGSVSLSTGVLDCGRDYLREAFRTENLAEGVYVFLNVSDTGVGIAQEIQDKIFDPFFSTKFAGRGLGLAATLGIVRAHKGAIKVSSQPGRGTTFRVLLPAAAGESAPEPAVAPHAAVLGGAGTVLVVDDEEDVRAVTKALLEQAGVQVLTAGDGREAVETFSRRAGEIACVLLDLLMPRMDGEETFRELRRIRADVPVVLSSGYSEQEAANRFAGQGLSGFIQKPYGLSELLSVLRRVSSRAQSKAAK